MAYCGKCGSKINNEEMFCSSCGAPVELTQCHDEQAQQNDYAAKIAALNETFDTTADFDKADIEQNKAMAILAYLSWLVLIPIFAAPKSKFARYHANQGIVLAIAEIAYGIVYGILSSIIYSISWRLGFIVSIIGLVGLVFLVMSVIGIINAANGRAKELPVIGKFKILK